MPRLNVARVITNPMFCETFEFIRRRRTVVDGMGAVQETRLKMSGVIQPAPKSKRLERVLQGDWKEGLINVWTMQKIEINNSLYLPDEIIFHNNRYQVLDIQDWSHYNGTDNPRTPRGYIEITAALVLAESTADSQAGYDTEEREISCSLKIVPSLDIYKSL